MADSDGSRRSSEAAKQAACLSCRRSKMKCIRSNGSTSCRKCLQRGSECVVPEYHIGRHKGVKNKRSGLDKAVHQIEEALRKSKQAKIKDDGESSNADLQELLKQSQEILSKAGDEQEYATVISDLIPAVQVQQTPTAPGNVAPTSQPRAYNHQSINSRVPERTFEGNSLAVNDAENPLQLLAQTSELLLAPSQVNYSPAATASMSSAADTRSGDPAHTNPQAFFSRLRSQLDNEPELDAIEIGLITFPEADVLFTFFYQQLAHTRWGVDPEIHSTKFVRKRSNFLFTSILAASALFLPSTAAMSRRLSAHCRKLALHVIKKRLCSVEIVLGFMIGIPWMSFGDHWADDETCSYLAMAVTMALDLSLNKIVADVPHEFGSLAQAGVGRADCIDPRRALDMDGFSDVDVSSSWGRRLLRRRERVWLSLFVLERGVCLARGRSNTLPMSPLVELCDSWHLSDIADTWDGSVTSIAVLRRDLAALIDRIRKACDSHEITGVNGTAIVESIQHDIDSFFDRWFATWPFQIGNVEKRHIPPYVEILVSHTRLSTYSSVINHPTAPINVKHFFRAAGLSSALNVMRAAVQGESRLKSMPNNTAIMISFAACFALRLSSMGEGHQSTLAPSVRTLIEETADVLDRIGGTPEHRKGVSAIFAKQLRRIVRPQPPPPTADVVGMPSGYLFHSRQQLPSDQIHTHTPYMAPEPLPFSGMSDNQIVEVINNAGVGLEASWADFQFDDGAGLDWLDWPV